MIEPIQVADPAARPAAEAVPSATRGTAGVLRGLIDELRAAFALLTRLPLPGSSTARTGVRAYALVGALLGLTTFLPLMTLGSVVPVAAAILALGMLAILSGGLHLDGLADTFDALAATGPDAAERARKDPAIGAAGATALIVVLGIDVAALAQILTTGGALAASVACVVAGAGSRLLPPVVARLHVSAASDSGLGAWFVRRTSSTDVAVVVATGLMVILAAAFAMGRADLGGAWVLAGFGSVAAGAVLVRVRGQLDGDLFGATVEIGAAMILLATVIVVAGTPA